MARKKAAEAPEVKEAPKKVYATVTGGSLNVRKDKSTDHAPVKVLKDGEQVEVVKEGKVWVKIPDGYVMRQYLIF